MTLALAPWRLARAGRPGRRRPQGGRGGQPPYFKKDAIAWGWEFVTSEKWLGLDKARLAATVFDGEGGAAPGTRRPSSSGRRRASRPTGSSSSAPRTTSGPLGDTGPCGPCSELHYFQGNDIPCAEEKAGKKCQGVARDCDSGWLEILEPGLHAVRAERRWQAVAAAQALIDTGAGLERMASVAQGKRSNYDTDLFRNLIAAIEKVAGKRYGAGEGPDDVSMRVIADHARATTFLVGDGVSPP